MNHAILQGQLVLAVNTARSPYDLHTMKGAFLTEFTTAFTDAKAANNAAIFSGGDVAGAQARVVESRVKLAGLLRNGYFHIQSLSAEDLAEADRTAALVIYGWAGGNLGDLEDGERVETLAGLAVTVFPPVLAPAAQYPLALRNRIINWLGILTGNKLIANGGTQATLIVAKDEKREALLRKLARVRFLYCFASDLGEGNPELERIGFQRRRAPGEAQSQPRSEVAGTATWNPATTELSLLILPAHATYLVAWRQPLGGQPEEAGVSTTATVGASQFSPFTPGATYDLWVTGRNSRGDGDASNKVRWTAPV